MKCNNVNCIEHSFYESGCKRFGWNGVAKCQVSILYRQKQVLAHSMVSKEKNEGNLTPQPCYKCGSKKETYAHHDDYDQPLAVRWLCIKCHAKTHQYLNSTSSYHEYIDNWKRIRLNKLRKTNRKLKKESYEAFKKDNPDLLYWLCQIICFFRDELKINKIPIRLAIEFLKVKYDLHFSNSYQRLIKVDFNQLYPEMKEYLK